MFTKCKLYHLDISAVQLTIKGEKSKNVSQKSNNIAYDSGNYITFTQTYISREKERDDLVNYIIFTDFI